MQKVFVPSANPQKAPEIKYENFSRKTIEYFEREKEKLNEAARLREEQMRTQTQRQLLNA